MGINLIIHFTTIIKMRIPPVFRQGLTFILAAAGNNRNLLPVASGFALRRNLLNVIIKISP